MSWFAVAETQMLAFLESHGLEPIKTSDCLFANLPERVAGRRGQGLAAEKVRDCIWLQPELVAQTDFLVWTGAVHLLHARFVALGEDKNPSQVVRET